MFTPDGEERVLRYGDEPPAWSSTTRLGSLTINHEFTEESGVELVLEEDPTET
jgi:hypothetical protein